MQELSPRNIFTSILKQNTPAATALIKGNANYPNLFGFASFYNTPFGGILINAEVYGLPAQAPSNMAPAMQNNSMMASAIPNNSMMSSAGNTVSKNVVKNAVPDSQMYVSNFFGMHIHEVGDCTLPFDKTGGHYNPTNASHPEHAGDLPPLLSNNGYAWTAFYTGRLRMDEIIGKSIIIHGMRDDFTTQPAGDSGEKIGCGVIQRG